MLLEWISLILFVIIFLKINKIEKMLEQVAKRLQNTHTEQMISYAPDNLYTEKALEEETIEKEVEVVQTAKEETFVYNYTPAPTTIKASSPKSPSFMQKIKARYDNSAIEELLFGNIILKIGVIAFILGIGLFLKYSIDKNWIPVWGRALIGVAIGISMLIAGIKLMKNENKLFSEGLFGGGIAILYLSIFAGYALQGFMFLPFTYAFAAMIAITFLSGLISIRFNAKSTAIFGLIGGFLTPFLISSGSQNVVGLLSYMLVLNLGVLYISVYIQWAILSWMAFVITALSQLFASTHNHAAFVPMLLLFGIFFIIYSIVPFINEIREKRDALKKSFIFLFAANFMVALGSYSLLFNHFFVPMKTFAIVTIGLASYLLLYAGFLGKKNLFLKNLFFIVLAQAIALLLLTPALVFSDTSLTIVWAVESLMLLWIASNSNEKLYAFFSMLGFAITLVRYTIFDLVTNLNLSSVYSYANQEVSFLSITQNFTVTSFFVLGSFFLAYKILSKSLLTFTVRGLSSSNLQLVLFLTTFVFSFVALNSISYNLLSEHHFTLIYMILITFYALWLYKSDYKSNVSYVFYTLLGLLLLAFISMVFTATSTNTTDTLVQFIVFITSFTFLYQLGFKTNSYKVKSYTIAHLMLALGVGLLFIFLNIQIQNILMMLDKTEAIRFAITILWVLFGITLFVFGILKDNNTSKLTGTILIFLAILKAFLFDLSDLDYIFKILLFILLGMLLFGLSFFYQSKSKVNELQEKGEEK